MKRDFCKWHRKKRKTKKRQGPVYVPKFLTFLFVLSTRINVRGRGEKLFLLVDQFVCETYQLSSFYSFFRSVFWTFNSFRLQLHETESVIGATLSVSFIPKQKTVIYIYKKELSLVLYVLWFKNIVGDWCIKFQFHFSLFFKCSFDAMVLLVIEMQ